MVIDGVEYIKKSEVVYQKQPKYKVGQVVWWGNGFEEYVLIDHIHVRHEKGASQSYSVQTRSGSRSGVSEEVLRPLTAREMGLEG